MKKHLIHLICAAACSAVLLLSSCQGNQRYVITDFGAVGDSLTMNTEAIQKLIDECSAKGGGTIVVPQGTFLTGALFFKQGVNLYLEAGGKLKGSVVQEDYPNIDTRWEGIERNWTSAMINFTDVNGCVVSGEGTIDGSGDIWLANSNEAKRLRTALIDSLQQMYPDSTINVPAIPYVGRPRLICFQNCSNVIIRDINLHNQAVWCLHILYSKHVLAENLHISANHDIPSSDGIDIDSSTDVVVDNCTIDVNDDCISIKAGKDSDGLRVNRPSENITVKNCLFGYGHGGVAMGSETSGCIRKVLIVDCIADAGNWAPIRFKTQPSRSGVVEDIEFRNIEIRDARQAFEMNMEWRMVNPLPPAEVLPVFRNIRLVNVHGKANATGSLHGLDDSPIQNVVFEDCSIQSYSDLQVSNVEGLQREGLHVELMERQARNFMRQ